MTRGTSALLGRHGLDLGLQKSISKEEKVPFGRPRATPSSSYAAATSGVK